MTQLRLPLGPGPEADDAGFIVSQANAAAVHMLDHWATWPVMAALLTGPRKSGRSRLGRIFAARSGGTLIDNAETHPEADIFHAWNLAQAERRPLLIIADAVPPEWSVELPDLRSRITATPKLRIDPPDDALMDALLRHRFEHDMLYAAPEVLNWLAHRADRSYVALDRIADLLEAEAHARDVRRLTIPFSRAVLLPAGLLSQSAGGAGEPEDEEASEDQ